jgi:hypothetical protein
MVSSNDGRLTSQWPSLLGVTIATGNLMLDYQLLLNRFKFRHSEIQVCQGIIIRYIDRNLLNTSCITSSNTCSHWQLFIIKHHTSFVYTSWYKFPMSSWLLCLSLLYVISWRRKLGHVTIRSMVCTMRRYIFTHEEMKNYWWNCRKLFIRKRALWCCRCLDKSK